MHLLLLLAAIFCLTGSAFAAQATIQSVAIGSASGPATYGTSASITYTVTITKDNSSNTINNAHPSVTGLPSGVTGAFSPSSLDFSSTPNEAKQTTLTLTVSSSAAAGTYTFTVTQDKTTGVSTTGTLVVNKANSTTSVATSGTPTVFGQSVTFTATITAPTGATGQVTFKDGANTLGTANLSAGSASFSSSSLSVGGHLVTAQYAGDSNVNSSNSNTITQTVNAASTTTTISSITPASPVYGQQVTMNAHVAVNSPGSGTPTGTVTFKDGTTTLGTGNLDASGNASFSTSTLTATSHSITANYGGTSGFNSSSSSPSSLTVVKASTSISLTSSNTDANQGASVNFTATLSISAPGGGTPAGSVTFKDGTTVLGTGALVGTGPWTATLPTSSLSVGSHSITADYGVTTLDPNYNGSTSNTVTQQVRFATTVALSSGTNPSSINQAVALQAHLGGSQGNQVDPTGNVVFKDNGVQIGTAPIGNGRNATLNFTFTTPGSHPLTAEYAGDTNYKAASDSLTQTVNANTTTTVAANPASSTFGQSVVFTSTSTATTGGTPATGAVVLTEGTTTLQGSTVVDSNGQATFTTTALGGGSHTITATFTGSNNFGNSVGTLTFTVNPANQTISFTAVGGKTYGDAPFSLSATASSGLPVTFSVVSGPATISGSTVTITGAGTIVLQASQAGNANYNPASASQSVVVAKANATVTVNGYSGTYDGAAHGATGTATGVFGENLSSLLSFGSSFTNVPGGTANWTFNASNANGNYNSQSGSVAITINKASQTITFPAIPTTKFGQTVTLSATSNSGLPVSFSVVSGPGSISGNSLTFTGPTNANSSVTVRASQAGDTNYNAAVNVDQAVTVLENVAATSQASQNPGKNGNGWNKTSVQVTLSATDNNGGSGVSSITYSVDGGSAQTVSQSSVMFTVSGDGSHTIHFHSTDNANNVEADQSYSLQIDTIAPAPDSGTPNRDPDHVDANGHGWYTSPVQVTFHATDAGSGIDGAASTTVTTLSGFESDHAFVTATFADLAGNMATGTFNYFYDDKAPIIGIGGISDQAVVKQTGGLQVNVTEAFPDGDPVVTIVRQSDSQSFSYVPGLILDQDGIYTMTVTAKDLAGHVTTQTINFTVLHTAPTITFTSPDTNGGVYNTDQTVSWTAIDAVGVAVANIMDQLAMMLPGGDVTINNPQFFSGYVTSNEGNHSATVQATDRAGNQSTATMSFLVDKTAPTLTPATTGVNGANDWFRGAGVTVSASANDPLIRAASGSLAAVLGSGVKQIVYSATGAQSIDPTTVNGNSATLPLISVEGSTTVHFDASDNAGNHTAGDFTVKLDRTPPVLANVPSSFSVPATGVDGANVTFPSVPTATDNLSDAAHITIHLDHDSGALFPIGVTTVTVTATDDAGNQSSQSFTVTVFRPQPTLTTINPDHATYGDGNVSITLTGTGFMPDSVVKVDGVAVSTGFVSWTSLTAIVPSGGAGAKNITVTTPASSLGNDGGDSGAQVFTVNKADQTINFGSIADKTYGDADFTISATATSGLGVTFTVASGHATVSGNTVHITGAGPVSITAHQSGDNNWNAAPDVSQTFNVAKFTPTITIGADSPVIFDGNPHGATATVAGVNGDSLTADIAYTPGGANAPVHAGTYTATASFGGNDNYNAAASVSTQIQINPAHAVLSFTSDLSPVYDGTPKPVTLTVDPNVPGGAVTYNGSPTAPTDAGSYTIVGTLSNNDYVADPITATLAIQKKPVTVTLDGLTGTFNGHPHEVTATTADPSGLNVHITYAGSDQPPTNAGKYHIVGTVVEDNYQGSAEGCLDIAKADSSVTIDDVHVTYDGHSHSATAHVHGVDNADLGTVDVVYPTDDHLAPLHAGTYHVTAHFDGNNNYNPSDGNGTIQIDKADPTVTLDTSGPFTYDGTGHAATVTVTGVMGEALTETATVTYDGGAALPVHAGDHSVAAHYPGNMDYNAKDASGNLHIDKATPTLQINGLEVPYDGHAHPATATVTGVPGDTLTAAITYTPGGDSAPVDAGTYTATASFGGNPDYNGVASQSAQVIIDKVHATINVQGGTFTYDGHAHGATGTATGVLGEDLSSLLNFGQSFTDVPGGAANWTFAGNNNYLTDNGSATITINQADATVHVTGFNGVYDGQAHHATGTATGVNGEDLSSLLDFGQSFTDVPGGTANWSFAGNNNYKPQSGSVDITITKANATVNVQGYTGTFDGHAHGATGTAMGVHGDDLTSLLDLGQCFTNVPGGTANWNFPGNTNYNSQSGSVQITINKANATVHVTDYNGVYDAQPHHVTGSATGVNGEDLTSLLDFGQGYTNVPGGPASWSFNGNNANGNYNSQSGTAQVTITKANATVHVTNYNGVYDAQAHHVTGTASGVNGENLNSLLDLGASYTNVPGGTANWNFPGNGNYNATSGTAQVTITQATPTIVVNGGTYTYNGNAHPATGSVTGVNGENLGAPTFSYAPGGASAPVNAGSYGVTGSFAGNPNYTAVSGTATILINKATPTMTWNQGGPAVLNSTLTLNATMSNGGAITYSGPGVSGNVATFGTIGTVNITANYAGDANYNSVTLTKTFTVTFRNTSGILPPINSDGSSVFKSGSTVPMKVQVFDANGVSVSTPGTIQGITCVQWVQNASGVNEQVDSTTPDTTFRWDSTGQQWIFNCSTKNLPAGYKYRFTISLADGTSVIFYFSTK